LESVGAKPDLGLEDELNFVLCDDNRGTAMFLDDELRELSDEHRPFAREQ
jgi:hypothetical protein